METAFFRENLLEIISQAPENMTLIEDIVANVVRQELGLHKEYAIQQWNNVTVGLMSNYTENDKKTAEKMWNWAHEGMFCAYRAESLLLEKSVTCQV